MNMQSQKLGILSYQELSDSCDSSRSDPTYHSISSRPNSLSVNKASSTNNIEPEWLSSSTRNYPTKWLSRNADMLSNCSAGYITTEHVHPPPRQRRSLFTSKRWILIGCMVIIVLLIGVLATSITSLVIQTKVSELIGGKEGDQVYITSPPKEITTIHDNMSESSSETNGLTTALKATTSTTESESTTTKLSSSSTATTLLPTTATSTATTTTKTTTTTTKPMTTSTSLTNESCTRKCHSCSSKFSSSLCPKNGTIPNDPRNPLMDCPCDTTCYTEIRSDNEYAVYRGCTKDFPHWDVLARVNQGCQFIGANLVCFCLGDRCNTDDMTVFSKYKIRMDGLT